MLSDRICIWRLKKLKEALELWRAIAAQHNVRSCFVEWSPYSEELEETWKTFSRIFTRQFSDSEPTQMMEVERRALKDSWYAKFDCLLDIGTFIIL